MPNIILLMSDDQGWSETGYNGHPYVKTPVLDEMARGGVRFNSFYAASPVCTPTRASVITGRNSNRCGALTYSYSLRPEEISIAHLVRKKGYVTSLFGKWHLGPSKAVSPVNPGAMGFDYWLSHDNFFGVNPMLSRNGSSPEQFHGEGSEIIVSESISWIQDQQKSGQPFFTVIWFGSPHGPYASADHDFRHYEFLRHKMGSEVIPHRYAEITAMDRSIGHLQDYLKEQGLFENTIIWFCSDNGLPKEALTDHETLRGRKGLVYENGIRVPSVLQWPAKFSSPKEVDAPCVTSDILPTLCDFLDIDLPQRPLDGISIENILNKNLTERPSPICFWYYDFKQVETEKLEWYMEPELLMGDIPTSKIESIQFQNFVHPVAQSTNFGGISAVRGNQYKLVQPKPGVFELYDMDNDLTESTNLVMQHPEIAEPLRKKLLDWQRSVERSHTGSDYSNQ
ncbi:MAG: sulfatase-like hydrolase/transferase [Verrucomicrobiota bacterium]